MPPWGKVASGPEVRACLFGTPRVPRARSYAFAPANGFGCQYGPVDERVGGIRLVGVAVEWGVVPPTTAPRVPPRIAMYPPRIAPREHQALTNTLGLSAPPLAAKFVRKDAPASPAKAMSDGPVFAAPAPVKQFEAGSNTRPLFGLT